MECLLPIWHKEISISGMLLEDYSEGAHQSAIAFAIEFSTSHQEQEEQIDDIGSESKDNDYGEIMNSTKVKIISHDFLQALPECPLIHWPNQMLNDPKICFCPCSHITKPWREKQKVSIHPNHGCKTKNMTPMQLLNHFEREGNSTHKAILVYLNQLATFQRGPSRHIPSKGVSVSLFFLHDIIYCMNFIHNFI